MMSDTHSRTRIRKVEPSHVSIRRDDASELMEQVSFRAAAYLILLGELLALPIAKLSEQRRVKAEA